MALTTGLQGYWKLDESSGNATDITGATGTLTNTSVTYTTGKINNGATFEGTVAKLVSPTKTLTAAFTYSAWVKRNALQLGVLFSNYLAADDAAFKNCSILFYVDGVNLRLQAGNHLGWVADTTTSFASGTWYHIAVVATGSTFTLYVNGAQTATGSLTHAESTGKAFTFGTRSDTPAGQWYSGMKDEIGIWDRALTSVEIVALYGAGFGYAHPLSSSFKARQTRPALFKPGNSK